MTAKVIKNWGIDVHFKNLMTGEERNEYFERIQSEQITPLYMSPDNHFYTIGKLGLFNVDKYLNHNQEERQ